MMRVRVSECVSVCVRALARGRASISHSFAIILYALCARHMMSLFERSVHCVLMAA